MATVAANNASKTYDGLAWNGIPGVTYSGFVNGESAAVLSGTLSYGGNAQGAVHEHRTGHRSDSLPSQGVDQRRNEYGRLRMDLGRCLFCTACTEARSLATSRRPPSWPP